MIPIEIINLFASKDMDRLILTKPRLVDGMIVATDGRVMIEVPDIEVNFFDPAPIDGKFPNYRIMFTPELGHEAVPIRAPVIQGTREEHSHECEICAGTKTHGFSCEVCDHMHENHMVGCDDCGGTGKILDYFAWRATCEGSETGLGGLYVEMILQLPNVRWFKSAGESSPYPFTFGDNGRGLLMPIGKVKP